MRVIAIPLTERLAFAPELLAIFAIAQAAMFAALGEYVGLGKEKGELLSGISVPPPIAKLWAIASAPASWQA